MLTTDPLPEVVVLPPREVDAATAGQLAADLRAACGRGAGRVVVDFSGVLFCDLAAVRVLLEAAAAARQHGCELQVRHPDRFLQRMATALDLSERLGLTPPGTRPSPPAPRASPPEPRRGS